MSRFDDLKARIIFAIWIESQRPGSKSELSMSEIEELLPEECVTGQTRAAIESLAGDGGLSRQGGAGKFYISESGIRSIEYEIAHPGSLIYNLNYAKQLGEAAAATPEVSHRIPAADRIVSLDHNGEPYRAAIEALDAAVAAFREDHLLDNEWGPEKGVLIRSVEAGRELLNETEVRVATVFSTVIVPLQIARQKYDDAIVAGLVTAGAEQLIHLVQHAITSVLAMLGLS